MIILNAIINYLKNYFKPSPRLPAHSIEAAALTGAVILSTGDGNAIVITPKLARELGEKLPLLASQADQQVPA